MAQKLYIILCLSTLLNSVAFATAERLETPAVLQSPNGELRLAPGFRLQNVDANQLFAEMERSKDKVQEFKWIQELAGHLGIKVYLFGGAAATYAHYIKMVLQQSNLNPSFVASQLDFDLTNIYRSSQDIDLVVDGPQDRITEFSTQLKSRYAYTRGNQKSKWEVIALHTLLETGDYQKQHLDSVSTGLFLLNRNSSETLDLSNSNHLSTHQNLQWLHSIAQGSLAYYFSAQPEETARAKDGRNPPLLSVLRALIKASQFGLDVQPQDRQQFKRILEQTLLPNASPNPNASYVQNWIKSNLPKLVKNALDIEYAYTLINEFKLNDVRLGFDAHVHRLFNRQPLMSFETNPALTSSEPVDAVTSRARRFFHGTKTWELIEAIGSNPFGRPNALISRQNQEGEAAHEGNGFYIAEEASPSVSFGRGQWIVEFELMPNAREGLDYERKHALLFHNRNALRVRHHQSLSQYLTIENFVNMQILGPHAQVVPAEILALVKNRIALRVWTTQELERALQLILTELEKPTLKLDVLRDLLSFSRTLGLFNDPLMLAEIEDRVITRIENTPLAGWQWLPPLLHFFEYSPKWARAKLYRQGGMDFLPPSWFGPLSQDRTQLELFFNDLKNPCTAAELLLFLRGNHPDYPRLLEKWLEAGARWTGTPLPLEPSIQSTNLLLSQLPYSVNAYEFFKKVGWRIKDAGVPVTWLDPMIESGIVLDGSWTHITVLRTLGQSFNEAHLSLLTFNKYFPYFMHGVDAFVLQGNQDHAWIDLFLKFCERHWNQTLNDNSTVKERVTTYLATLSRNASSNLIVRLAFILTHSMPTHRDEVLIPVIQGLIVGQISLQTPTQWGLETGLELFLGKFDFSREIFLRVIELERGLIQIPESWIPLIMVDRALVQKVEEKILAPRFNPKDALLFLPHLAQSHPALFQNLFSRMIEIYNESESLAYRGINILLPFLIQRTEQSYSPAEYKALRLIARNYNYNGQLNIYTHKWLTQMLAHPEAILQVTREDFTKIEVSIINYVSQVQLHPEQVQNLFAGIISTFERSTKFSNLFWTLVGKHPNALSEVQWQSVLSSVHFSASYLSAVYFSITRNTFTAERIKRATQTLLKYDPATTANRLGVFVELLGHEYSASVFNVETYGQIYRTLEDAYRELHLEHHSRAVLDQMEARWIHIPGFNTVLEQIKKERCNGFLTTP